MRKGKKKAQHSQRFAALAAQIEKGKVYDLGEALSKVKELASAKFTEGVDVSVKLGIDPRKDDQKVRGNTNLPHGTGKARKVAVLASGDLAKEAKEAGADTVGDDDLIKMIQEGWRDFDVMLATPDMAPQIGKIGRILGAKSPNKKNGTVTEQIGDAVKDIKGATRVEYRVDKAGIIHMPIGRVTFPEDHLRANFNAAIDALYRAKPSGAKGRYLVSVTVSSTMGPGFRLDPTAVSKEAGH
jgi:large subunit ribosomal protein L1